MSNQKQEDEAPYLSYSESHLSDEYHQKLTKWQHVRLAFKAFRLLSSPYFARSDARRLFLLLVTLMLMSSAVRVIFSYISRDYWSALSGRDEEQFYNIVRNFCVALVVLAPLNVLYRYQRERLALQWREWMTERMLKLYATNRVYYTLEADQVDQSKVDNPDQRICEDVRSFTHFSLTFFLTLAISIIDLVAFSVILYTIQPMLFVSIISFATLGSVGVAVIGQQLMRLNVERLQKEADLRFSLVRVRENAESIAFYSGEPMEQQQILNRLDQVVDNKNDIIVTKRNLDFLTTLYNYVTWTLPLLLLAPAYFGGVIELGVMQQAAVAFGHVLEDLSFIVWEFDSLAEFSASIRRLYQFLQAIQKADPDRDEHSPLLGGDLYDVDQKDGLILPTVATRGPSVLSTIQLTPSLHAATPLTVRNLSVSTPDYTRTLVKNLSLSVNDGDHVLICGPSGAGKSSLVRSIAGLWTAGSGSIERTSDVCFLPQKPYCPVASLRNQLLYPHNSENQSDKAFVQSDEQLIAIMKQVNLMAIAEQAGNGNVEAGLDAVLDWSNRLSLGEQQRLAFGRVLLHRPRLLILDESTSAMDVQSERQMYDLLREWKVSYISVGHRPTLVEFHDSRLEIRGMGEFSIGRIE
ncbi:putative ATP-binding cassette transporter [Fistulifera solaris]|uniref:Putative ATP-binding cassette transporter n=1 Tax=Fistulifera solaris TaxID=1519565 RepID=A0A1Z5JW50_FISSO|nr:putative ATP-binding cassette transporter [Fistulifera solaris]|eukprot:GAX18265.1 putative ATP-binding cassette transporter [Fistulifera solaris]